MAVSCVWSHTDFRLSQNSPRQCQFQQESSLPKSYLQKKNQRRDCKCSLFFFVGLPSTQIKFQPLKPKCTRRTVCFAAQSNPKEVEKTQNGSMEDLLKPLIPIAASFIIFSLGLGARVAAASSVPVTDRLIRGRLLSFANVSSIASSPSPTVKNTVENSENGTGSSEKTLAPKPLETNTGAENNGAHYAYADEQQQHIEEVQVKEQKEDIQVKEQPGDYISNYHSGIGTEVGCNENEKVIHQETESLELPSGNQMGGISGQLEFPEDKELTEAYEQWRSKPYALTVPLRIVALRGSLPPAWLKDFVQSQGRRLKFQAEFQGSLRHIISELASAVEKGRLTPRSVMAADLVTLGDSWLELAICGEMIEPIENAEQQDWYNCLSSRWKAHLRRDRNGQIDPTGEVWGAPYRWGSMVVAYRKDKFAKHNIPPIEDWDDLWRPELKGKISMVDAPREVVGAVLKYMGASYNAKSFESDVPGGRSAVRDHFLMLQKQVRLFDSVHYLKAFGSGDVWVAVGWTSDVVPAAKRMSNVAVTVPKSGTSLWADLWTIPATRSIPSDKVGGRVRGPSPLIHQWFDFCLQPARATPFQQDVISGASPLFLPDNSSDLPNGDDSLQNKSIDWMQTLHVKKGGPRFDTNLIAGMPPAEILSKSEFLEPLSDEALLDYKWLMNQTVQGGLGWPSNIWQYLKGIRETFKIAPIRGVR